MDAANVQHTFPCFLCSFWHSGFLGLLDWREDFGNLWEKLARPERSAKESLQYRGVHDAESLKPQREPWRNIFLVLDGKAK